jgi:hypothetical protein
LYEGGLISSYVIFVCLRIVVSKQYKTQDRKLKNMDNTGPIKTGMNIGAREGQAVAASYTTPAMLLV